MSDKSTAVQVLYAFLRTEIGDPHAMDQLSEDIRRLKAQDDPDVRVLFDTFLYYLQHPVGEHRLRSDLKLILKRLLNEAEGDGKDRSLFRDLEE